jgi:hypothetical protein
MQRLTLIITRPQRMVAKDRKLRRYVAHPPRMAIGANGAKPVETG